MRDAPTAILIRGVNWLGDAVISTAALLRLREALPESSLTMFCPAKLADLWKHHPAVDEVLSFAPAAGVFAAAKRLREKNFDAALIFPNSFRSALEPCLARIPRRIGYGGGVRGWMLTHLVKRRKQRQMRKRPVAEIQRLIQTSHQPRDDQYTIADHHLHHYLQLASAFGASAQPLAPRLQVAEEELRQFREKHLAASDHPSRRIFGLNPGAEYGPAKRWPKERFIETAVVVARRIDCRWLVFGGPEDRELGEQIAAGIRAGAHETSVLNLAGETSLRELMSGLKICDALLTNDTGPMHVAAALGTRVIVPFGSTSPELTGPGLPGSAVHTLIKGAAPCAPCFRRECPIDFRCMRSISAAAVVEAILQ